jgi:AhpD family alkylhydroperoxidase
MATPHGVHPVFGLSESVIPTKYKQLIGLAVASHIQCHSCISFHTQEARAHGATDAELHEARSMGLSERTYPDRVSPF